MWSNAVTCPVHLYERMLCDADCDADRRAWRKLHRDYRQYWYDRRRGQRSDGRTYTLRDRRPLWQAWGRA